MKHSIKPRESWNINKLKDFRINNPKENKPKIKDDIKFEHIYDSDLLVLRLGIITKLCD